MDILDIDEELKDDSFIFLEDKTHDDVSNILRQWKSNNCLPPQQPEQVYKLNSRTFTRPKRKSAQNLDSQFLNTSYTNCPQQNQQQQQHQARQNGSPVLNLEIGGLVTTMHKSFLQDTSPPSSICSSINVSLERMNNSLITSADFSNLNFLQSTQSLDFNDAHGLGFGIAGRGFNLTDKSTNDGYTLSDMIRDRKALESLTMSGDGALIKDSHIAQIDDISLTFSKTASDCSTMDNSTESVEGNNRTVEFVNQDRTFEATESVMGGCSGNAGAGDVGPLHRTMVLHDEMIGDTTFNLVENSMCVENGGGVHVLLNVTHEAPSQADVTFKKPNLLDETVCLSGKGNSTFDCNQATPDARCETPENVEKSAAALKFYESTPQAASIRCNKQQYTPSIKIAEDVNISPIVAPNNGQLKAHRILNETFDQEQQKAAKCKLNSDTFSGALPHFEAEELLENIANPNETFSRSYQRLDQSAAGIEMQNVMDLAQAEAELLAGNDDEAEFEHMLDEFSKVELNPEQLKMKKSLETIKKRFNYGLSTDKGGEREISREARDMRELLRTSGELTGSSDEGSSTQGNLNVTIEIRNDELRKQRESMRDSMRDSREQKTSFLRDSLTGNTSDLKCSMLNSKDFMKELRDSSANSLTSSSISGSSRLLGRRSRLYDDINLSTLSAQSKSPGDNDYASAHTKETEQNASTQGEVGEKTEEKGPSPVVVPRVSEETNSAQCDDATDTTVAHKLAEKRQRDRDRFKTIKIVKQRTPNGEESAAGLELNVPCIDDEVDDVAENGANQDPENETVQQQQQQTQRYSRRDHASPVFNNNESEVQETADPAKRTSKINTNYLTYKKPKDKQLPKRNLPEIAPAEEPTAPAVAPKSRLEPRSLSRPRFISGLQKFSVVSKATSAGDLEKTTAAPPRQLMMNTTTGSSGDSEVDTSAGTSVNFNRTQPSAGGEKVSADLKSPMGIKSKSFHNLSSNFGYASAPNNSGFAANRAPAFGLKKLNNGGQPVDKQFSKVNSSRATISGQHEQKTDDSVFKVPKLVSGIRAPGTAAAAAAIKRAGLVRPSSGYYSLNVTAKGVVPANDADADTGRHSPTDSMSSASSRGSVQSGTGSGMKPLSTCPTIDLNLTKITTGSTGLPKPSGLRPPSNIKRSGLPRPASIVRR